MRKSDFGDALIGSFGAALTVLAAAPHASRKNPADLIIGDRLAVLDEAAKKESGALMRVNHVGEVCAQALYSAQALVATDPVVKHALQAAALEEADHLAWTAQRLKELGARPSIFNPLWFAGSFALGLVAARAGDAVSLAFVVETERQVEAHLADHLIRLPVDDVASRAIVEQMRDDEIRHGAAAGAAGAGSLPPPVKAMMQIASKVMTTTAHYI